MFFVSTPPTPPLPLRVPTCTSLRRFQGSENCKYAAMTRRVVRNNNNDNNLYTCIDRLIIYHILQYIGSGTKRRWWVRYCCACLRVLHKTHCKLVHAYQRVYTRTFVACNNKLEYFFFCFVHSRELVLYYIMSKTLQAPSPRCKTNDALDIRQGAASHIIGARARARCAVTYNIMLRGRARNRRVVVNCLYIIYT